MQRRIVQRKSSRIFGRPCRSRTTRLYPSNVSERVYRAASAQNVTVLFQRNALTTARISARWRTWKTWKTRRAWRSNNAEALIFPNATWAWKRRGKNARRIHAHLASPGFRNRELLSQEEVRAGALSRRGFPSDYRAGLINKRPWKPR